MNNIARVKSVSRRLVFLKTVAYAFFVLMLQAQVFSRLPYPALRADAMLPLMFGVGVEWPPLLSLFWALFWGYVMDTLSGQFWGLHVGSYIVTVSIINVAMERFDFQNPLYQIFFVGLCAVGQSIALGLYMCFEPLEAASLASTWTGLAIRSLTNMVIAPFILFPIWSMKIGMR